MEGKLVAAFVLVLVMVCALLAVLFNYDTIFDNSVNITFPDGCVEVYKNGNLTTPICENGRELRDKQIKELDPEEWNKIHNIT